MKIILDTFRGLVSLESLIVARQSQGALILRTFALELHTSGPDD